MSRLESHFAVLATAMLIGLVPQSAQGDLQEEPRVSTPEILSADAGAIHATASGVGLPIQVESHVESDQVISTIRDSQGAVLSRVAIGAFAGSPVDSVADFASAFIAAVRQAGQEQMSAGPDTSYGQAIRFGVSAIYQATSFLGLTPLRQALLMHVSVLDVVKHALTSGTFSVTLCNESGSGVAFHCYEDHVVALQGSGYVTEWIYPPGTYDCGGIKGSDCGCCGNYSGSCWYCNYVCLYHDIACQLCWPPDFCLPGCHVGLCWNLLFSPAYGEDNPYPVPKQSYYPIIVYPNDTSPPRRLSSGASLAGPSPNPSLSGVRVQFMLSKTGPASLKIYSVSGAVVKTLAEGTLVAGPHLLQWDRSTDDGGRVGPGVYFCELKAGGERLARQIVMLGGSN